MIQPEYALEINESIDQSFIQPRALSILMIKKYPEITHFEIDPNSQQLLYDDALNALKASCQNMDLEVITSIKFHTNTWGLSSCNYFAEHILSKMTNLTVLDLSDTLKYRPRSDLCMSTKALLSAVKNVKKLDLSNNFLDGDGARAFSEFLASSKTIQILKVNGCKMNDKSLEMIMEAMEKNPELELNELHMGRNDFSDSELLKKITNRFKNLEVLDISDTKFDTLNLPTSLRFLNVSGMKFLHIRDLAPLNLHTLIIENGPSGIDNFLLESFKNCWNLNSKLREIHLDKNQSFLEDLKMVYNMKINKIVMVGAQKVDIKGVQLVTKA